MGERLTETQLRQSGSVAPLQQRRSCTNARNRNMWLPHSVTLQHPAAFPSLCPSRRAKARAKQMGIQNCKVRDSCTSETEKFSPLG